MGWALDPARPGEIKAKQIRGMSWKTPMLTSSSGQGCSRPQHVSAATPIKMTNSNPSAPIWSQPKIPLHSKSLESANTTSLCSALGLGRDHGTGAGSSAGTFAAQRRQTVSLCLLCDEREPRAAPGGTKGGGKQEKGWTARSAASPCLIAAATINGGHNPQLRAATTKCGRSGLPAGSQHRPPSATGWD